jgi:protein-disulfide isomerase
MRAPANRRHVLALAAASVAALAIAGCNSSEAAAANDMSMGKANAPVTVEEYASVTCSHCATFNEQVFPAFKQKHVDTGQVRYVFKEFLTPPQEVAAAGFLVARCAGPDKYFGVVDGIFRAQPEMFRTGDWRGTLLRVAQTAGMTEQQFNTCVSDQAALKSLSERVEAGAKRGVESTPTFYVNGKKLEGAPTLANLDAAIAAAKK